MTKIKAEWWATFHRGTYQVILGGGGWVICMTSVNLFIYEKNFFDEQISFFLLNFKKISVKFFYSVVHMPSFLGWLVGWLFGFYGVSTFVGYLKPNSVNMHIPFTNEYLVGKIFYEQDFICLHMI